MTLDRKRKHQPCGGDIIDERDELRRFRCVECGHTWPCDEEGYRLRTPGSKYATDFEWQEPCGGCGAPVRMTDAMAEVIGPYHSGCFGYPMCSRSPPHKGDCSQQEPTETNQHA